MVADSADVNPNRRVRIAAGVQASGRLHLGNYYGAVRQFIQLQNDGEALYFIANLHALSTVRDAHTLREYTFETALSYLSLGLDPTRTILFCQSDIPEITQLFWILGSLVPLSNLERAHSYKDKIARGVPTSFGLFAYPVLMAADILVFGADVVPVGKDQLQHLEFARNWATRFNMAFVAGYDPQDSQAKVQGHAKGILKLPDACRGTTAADPRARTARRCPSRLQHDRSVRRREEDQKKIMAIKPTPRPSRRPSQSTAHSTYCLRTWHRTTNSHSSTRAGRRAARAMPSTRRYCSSISMRRSMQRDNDAKNSAEPRSSRRRSRRRPSPARSPRRS